MTRTTLTSTPIGTAVSSQGNTEALRYEDPTVKALSITQQLERSITLPYIKGLLRGVVGSPTSHTVTDVTEPRMNWHVTDYPFRVTAFLGSAASPYPISTTITLRLVDLSDDGSTGQSNLTSQIKSGDELFVYVRDQGMIGNGNTGTTLVASSLVDFLTLRNGTVYGHGQWASLAEPLATFEKHFVH